MISGFEGLPDLIYSQLGHEVAKNGRVIKVQIYRLEDQPTWPLEVVNEQGTSTLWNRSFQTKGDTLSAFRDKLSVEGLGVFLDEPESRFLRRPG